MLRLWRNIEDKNPAIDAKVRRSVQTTVSIPIPEAGKGPIVRMNALPVLTLPGECQAITFRSEKEWGELHAATVATEGKLIFTKSDAILCWGQEAGQIVGLFTPVDDEHPHPEKVLWAEAVRVLFNVVDGRSWLLLDPDVWIWPPRARKDAAVFLDERRGNRYNKLYIALLDAWLAVLLGADRGAETTVSAYEGGTVAETPSFCIGSRTAYTRRLGS
ncbi:MAG: hypothetical protein ACRD9W_03300 [Terriglobia bacterium]